MSVLSDLAEELSLDYPLAFVPSQRGLGPALPIPSLAALNERHSRTPKFLSVRQVVNRTIWTKSNPRKTARQDRWPQ
ncbi:hypothetical protein PILCRDRAFT_828834 [Piloderma croceum F 1598]|uniref:Uncharacterized protein n=1 Tax=Piloderma croceum (strain F 1598) TaxID=765440 RepID=A0A0C3F1F6_PILCF|nr:hypothetical protein PILCRDRAFT_828834 [Piloderma croceum F 1598]